MQIIKKAIVTGAGGFIGGALVKKLINENVTVYGVDISEEKLKLFSQYDRFIPVIADFSQYNELSKIIQERNIDVFYHFAWKGVYGESLRAYDFQLDNAKYACYAIEQAIKLGCKKFVFAGTYNEYEIQTFINSDSFKPRYTCIYSGAKLAAEIICKTIAYNRNINYSAGLISMTYGERNFSFTLPNVIIRQLLNNERPKLIDGNIPYDLVYVDDVAEAFYRIGTSGLNLKSYYIGHRKIKSFKEIITELAHIVNPSIELVFGELDDTVNRDYNLIDLDALYNDTGFECKADFRESIMKTARWLKEEGI